MPKCSKGGARLQPKIGRLALQAAVDLSSAGWSRSSREQASAYYTSARHQADRRETDVSSLSHAAERATHSLTRSSEVVPRRASEQVRRKRQQAAHRGERRRPPASGGCYPQAAAGNQGPAGL